MGATSWCATRTCPTPRIAVQHVVALSTNTTPATKRTHERSHRTCVLGNGDDTEDTGDTGNNKDDITEATTEANDDDEDDHDDDEPPDDPPSSSSGNQPSLMFRREYDLEEFMLEHWDETQLGCAYDLFGGTESTGPSNGRQVRTDTGRMDMLAVSKDGSELLVVEFKRGKASDVAVGQVQRYMGYVQTAIAIGEQQVRGAIVAYDYDTGLRQALSVAPNIELYTYKVVLDPRTMSASVDISRE